MIIPSLQDATTFAIIATKYGFPLIAYIQLASGLERYSGKFATNTFYHAKTLATADFRSVVRPNVDTLYSEALVDLSTHDLVVTIPKVPDDRFYVFPFYDMYGNNFANLGTAGLSNAPGRYLVSYRPADPGYSPSNDSYNGYIYMPTPYGLILNRIQCNGPDDVPAVNALQVQFGLTPQPIPNQLAPKLTKALLFDGFSTNDTTVKLLELTARLSLFNLPEVASSIPMVDSVFQIAGLSRGSYARPFSVNLTRALAGATTAISSLSQTQFKKYFLDLGNGWSQVRDIYSGDFKDNYEIRAYVTKEAYLLLKTDQAIYPTYNGSTGLTSDKSYNVTFSGKPPVNGFWSLTVYDEEAYLVKNQWNIYSLGDRSAIEYPDGSLVYGKSGSSSDGEFSILLQTLDLPPPENFRPNWIPTPARNNGNGTGFQFNLRWYGPTQALMNGSYVYPTVTTLSEPITGA